MGVDGNISVTQSSGNHASGTSPSAFVATKYTSVANPNALPPEANVQEKSISDSFTLKYLDNTTCDAQEDLNLPSLTSKESSSRKKALNYGTHATKEFVSISSDTNSSLETRKLCRALTGDCNCSKCYDSSGYYWG